MNTVASACYLQGKNNRAVEICKSYQLHLPAVCKVKTTKTMKKSNVYLLHLPAICKVKTTNELPQGIK